MVTIKRSVGLASAISLAIATPARRGPDGFTLGSVIEHSVGDTFTLTNDLGDQCFTGGFFYDCDGSDEQKLVWVSATTFGTVANPQDCPVPVESNVAGGCRIDCETYTSLAGANCDTDTTAWAFEVFEENVSMVDTVSGQCAAFGDIEIDGLTFLQLGDCGSGALLRYNALTTTAPATTDEVDTFTVGGELLEVALGDQFILKASELCFAGELFYPCDDTDEQKQVWVSSNNFGSIANHDACPEPAEKDLNPGCRVDCEFYNTIVSSTGCADGTVAWVFEQVDGGVHLLETISGQCANFGDQLGGDTYLVLGDCDSAALLEYSTVDAAVGETGTTEGSPTEEIVIENEIMHVVGDTFRFSPSDNKDLCWGGDGFYECDGNDEIKLVWVNEYTFAVQFQEDLCAKQIEENLAGGCRVDCEILEHIVIAGSCDSHVEHWVFEKVTDSTVKLVDSVTGQCAIFGDKKDDLRYLVLGNCDNAALLVYTPLTAEQARPGKTFKLVTDESDDKCYVGGTEDLPCDIATLVWVDDKRIARVDNQESCLGVDDSAAKTITMLETCDGPEEWALQVVIDNEVKVVDMFTNQCAGYGDVGQTLDDCLSGRWFKYFEVSA